jgi:hypothetical protein
MAGKELHPHTLQPAPCLGQGSSMIDGSGGCKGPQHAHVGVWVHVYHTRSLHPCGTCVLRVRVPHQKSVCIAMMLAVCGCSPTAEMKTT